MIETKHTELPWELEQTEKNTNNLDILIKTNDEKWVSWSYKESNAEFIVRACNNHYKLLDTLKDIDNGDLYVLDVTRERVRQAIKDAS